MVRAAWRHAEVSGTETTHPFLPERNKAVVQTLAPVIRKGDMRIRLYAGKPGESDGTQR
jgi:hypothetical protein